MASWWRGLALVGLWVAVFVGCSGKSDQHDNGNSGAHGGASGAGQGISGGGSGSGTKGASGGAAGRGGAGGSGGTTSSEGGAAGAEEGRGRGGTVFAAGGSLAAGNGGSFAGSAGHVVVGGSAGASGTAGSTSGVPNGWFCAVTAYADGTCDCGCGARDADCKTTDIEQCERCNASGSCAGTNAACPGRIDAMDTTKCIQSPASWFCSNSLYSDGKVCNCGCGAPDPDCKDGTADSCDSCNDGGSCSHSDCPSSIDPNDNSKCYVPPGWTCGVFNYGDQFCDCGCGIPDPQCADQTDAACDFCTYLSCTGGADCQGRIDPTDNTKCTTPPPQWQCTPRLYNDKSNCDCGCGAPDPDCASLGVSDCDTCNTTGACSGLECPGLIDPNNNFSCVRPDHVPDGWTCPEYLYGDGYRCDCGCGVMDADCHGTELDACAGCMNCSVLGDCMDTVLATDITQCRPAPDGWTCARAQYHDGYTCDCGCGILDPDCASNKTSACTNCPTQGCTFGSCKRLSPTDNTTCTYIAPPTWKCDPAYYGDGATCDCGCGVADPDCKSSKLKDPGTGAFVCQLCNDPGSCSTVTCKASNNPIDPNDNSTCVSN